MIRALRNKFAKRKLNEKIQVWFASVIILMAVVIAVIASVLASRSLYQQSVSLADQQLEFMADSYASWFDTANNIINGIEYDDNVQDLFLKADVQWHMSDQFVNEYSSVKSSLDDFLAQNNNINFIIIMDNDQNKYVFSGKQSISVSGFLTGYQHDIQKTAAANDSGSLQFSYGNRYFHGDQYSGSFYFPLYSTETINNKLGDICINMSIPVMNEIQTTTQQEEMDLILITSNGKVISGTSDIGFLEMPQFQDLNKVCKVDGKYYRFEKVPGYNFYVVAIFSANMMYASSIRIAILIILVALASIIISIMATRRMVEQSYRPMNQVLYAMDQAEARNLDYRLDTEKMGEDFSRLGAGYNGMMEAMNQLVLDIQTEKEQAAQIKLSALQSQIKPHFLYNTLDCIRWQARAEGSQETSELIMALASYYRICLSKGKDIIPLHTELDHIHYYLKIQNARYGDIIQYEEDVPEELNEILIPKLTLQPLVENAIYHGIRVKLGFSGIVRITAERMDDFCIIHVMDSGIGMPEDKITEINEAFEHGEMEFGYGVRNVNRRIKLAFGGQCGLHYSQDADQHLYVDIKLPLKAKVKEESAFL